MRYQIVADAYRDLEGSTGRLQLIERLADLVRQTPDELLPTVALLCQGQIAPDFAGVELGMADRLAARAVATAAGVPAEQVLAGARDTGDLGLTAERLLADQDPDRPPILEVAEVHQGLHQVAQAEGTGSQGRKLAGLVGLLGEFFSRRVYFLTWDGQRVEAEVAGFGALSDELYLARAAHAPGPGPTVSLWIPALQAYCWANPESLTVCGTLSDAPPRSGL